METIKRLFKKYRPANGTEGLGFIEAWCDRCVNEGDEHHICEILMDSMVYEVDVSEYPVEFCMGRGGPICTAFRERPKPDYEDPKQGRLF